MFLKQGPSKIEFVEKLWTKEKSLVYGGPSLTIKKNKNNKNNKNKKIKNENKKIEKMKKIFRKKTPTKLSWAMSAKSDKTFFIQKEKKQNYHGPWVPNLILSYKDLYITK